MTDLEAAHVPNLAGTEAPNRGMTHGIAMHHELEPLVTAGPEAGPFHVRIDEERIQ
jgi:hypothetical protein